MGVRIARFEPPLEGTLLAAVEGFDCRSNPDAAGESLVADFFRSGQFASDAADAASTTYLALDDENVPTLCGYVTLAITQVRLTRSERAGAGMASKRSDFAAVRIAMLGVDIRAQGRGIGSALVDEAILHTAELSESVTARFVVVDALPGREGWYEQHGFAVCASEAERQRGERAGTTSMIRDLGPDPRRLLR